MKSMYCEYCFEEEEEEGGGGCNNPSLIYVRNISNVPKDARNKEKFVNDLNVVKTSLDHFYIVVMGSSP